MYAKNTKYLFCFLKKIWNHLEGRGALKLSILIVQKPALHQNGVEFRQQFIYAIRTSLINSYDDVQHRAISLEFCLKPRDTQNPQPCRHLEKLFYEIKYFLL